MRSFLRGATAARAAEVALTVLACETSLMLLDEPTSFLDIDDKIDVLDFWPISTMSVVVPRIMMIIEQAVYLNV